MKNIFKVTFLSLALVVAFSSCTKWEEMNTNPYGLTSEMLQADYNNIGAYFPKLMQCVFYNYYNAAWDYQIISILETDDWVGYMNTATVWNNGLSTPNYGENNQWTSAEWGYTYENLMSPIAVAIEPQVIEAREGQPTGPFDHFYAPALIIRVLAAHRMCDYYGPIIYTHYGEEGVMDPEFDSVKDAYNAFFKDLDEAYGYLDTFLSNPDNAGKTPFKNFDNWCGGDYNNWIKLCNSVRLRLAMHIVKVDPATAKAQAEKANNKYGFLETFDVMETHKTWNHPLQTVLGWGGGDTTLGAVLESLFLGWNDPRCGKMFTKTTNEKAVAAGREFWGFRLGPDPAVFKSADYLGLSEYAAGGSLPGYIFSSAEAYLLRAEGALRGWNMGGSAKELYEAGVKASFNQWGCGSADEYLKGTSLPIDFVDFANPQYNIKAVNTLCVKWNDAGSKEENLERIIDQKYIAMWPESIEAWTELRRTGYPKQYPIIYNGSQGVLKDDETPKRICYKASLQMSNPQGYSGALQKLGGPDNMATPLWWDVEGPNI